jgi:hypothetical protein
VIINQQNKKVEHTRPFYMNSGGESGTRTPDTRIMIPLL